MVRQADDSFVCFGAKPDKGFWTRDFDVTGSGKGTREESWTKELEGAVGEGWRTEAVDTGQQRDESAWVSPGQVKEDRSRWVGIPSSVVEFSLESTLALVYTCTQQMQCCITPFLRLN